MVAAANIEALEALALDLRWSWSHAGDEVWKAIDAQLWKETRNPWVVLKSKSDRHLATLFATPEFRRAVEQLAATAAESERMPTWFEREYADSKLADIAYFSMEFMLSEALPIYAGGLGNVAGDQLKTASDLGVPVLGIGLLYQQGYFRQVIDLDGGQVALHPYNDPAQLPITPVRTPDGDRLRLEIRLPGYGLWLRAWEAKVGRLRLYLLDSNDSANHPLRRGITGELYVGNSELRLQQEIVLGIGGWRLIERLGLDPEVCHLNEGHAAFAILDRARAYMEKHRVLFDTALAATRAGNVFTTHTAVEAGFDRYPPDMIERYLGSYADRSLQISRSELLALGRAPGDGGAFNMAYLAARHSGFVNAVSRVHAGVSRRIFAPLFPRWPEREVPIGAITNGVHTPSWDGLEADRLWTGSCGKDRWRGTVEFVTERVRALPDGEIWACRQSARASMIDYLRERLVQQLEAAGAKAEDVESARTALRPDRLTLGFARRFTAYKRPNLLLHDPERLARILGNPERPVQIIIAGKAHPDDAQGISMIRDWIHFVRRFDARPYSMFLSDDDMFLTERMVGGVDVWINTPRRPWEACGTSGMKVLVNGGLNLSERDGWWAEAYDPRVGWALGDGREHGDDAEWDAAEADRLYQILETEVIPEFYSRGADGSPGRWIARVRESMATLTPIYSANRSVREYLEQAYLPAARAYRRRTENGSELAKSISAWQRALERAWSQLRFIEIDVQSRADGHHFHVLADLGELAAAVRLELYADPGGKEPGACVPLERIAGETGDASRFAASVPATRPASDYTVRMVPTHRDAMVPLEAAHVLWQR